MFWSAGCYLLRAEGFSCSLDILYGGLEISELQFLVKKISNLVFQLYFFYIFGQWNPGSESGINESGSETPPIICSAALLGVRLRRFAIIVEKVRDLQCREKTNRDWWVFFVQSAAKENLNNTRVLYKLFPISRKPCGEILNLLGERGDGGSDLHSLFSSIVLSVFEMFFYLATTFSFFSLQIEGNYFASVFIFVVEKI